MKTLKNKIKLVIEKTNTGFSGYSKDFPIATTSKNFTELLSNSVEAINLYLEGQSLQITAENVEFEIDLQQFFQYYRVINAKFLAERIGMNETLLSQYVKGKKKPSPKQTEKILHGIHEIGRELTNINLFT